MAVANFGEVLPYPVTPLTLSSLQRIGDAAEMQLSSGEKVQMARRIYGRIYANEGGMRQRWPVVVASAAAYVVSPSALGPVAVNPEREMDRLSASYLIALAARAIREVGDLFRRAQEAGKHLATLSVDTVIRFRSAEERAEFSMELTIEINRLVAKYHDESAPGGRSHRLVLMANPLPEADGQSQKT